MMPLAQTDPFASLFEELGSAFRAQGTTWPALLHAIRVIVLVLLVAVPLWLMIRHVIRRFDPTAGPQNLFHVALRACGINTLDRALLCWMARRKRVIHPTALLLARPLYQQVVSEATRGLTPLLGDWTRRRLARLESMLFHEDSPRQAG